MANAKEVLEMELSDPSQYCVETTTEQWQDRLGNLDTFIGSLQCHD